MHYFLKILSFVVACAAHMVTGLYDFPSIHINIPRNERALLNTLTKDDLRVFVEQGSESVRKELRLEENLLNSAITVQNGSLSHNQLLETLANDKTKGDSEVAMRILRSSLYAYNTKCIEHNISGTNCRAFFSEKSIPKDTTLWEDCNKIVQGHRDGHHVLRRLLPSNYQDGFYRMFTEVKLPSARLISSKTLHGQHTNVVIGNEALDEGKRNLALVQWAQFIEHDLSKPVATSMKNGEPIECCNHENYKLAPRYQHPACAPLMDKNHQHKHGRETCLNYVRSALAVGSTCNFGGAEQLNQATDYLDLSQLYGYTKDEEQLMRTYRFGQIKSSQPTSNPTEHLLPLATSIPNVYCALKLGAQNESCFMAGDSRVNSNPFSIVLYTIFMRSHNRIANDLHIQHSEWNDNRLYSMAKSININIYRHIVLKEWLPAVLGQHLTDRINAEKLQRDFSTSSLKISNEFAVAAVRFYLSMMPNVLHDLAARPMTESGSITTRPIDNNDISPSPNIFALDEQMHRSGILSSAEKLNNILESILHQRAMKMDGNYAETLIENFMGTNHPRRADALAFDIQRGRDHGLQGYVKYLELCQGITVRGWNDLDNYIDVNDIEKLRTAYDSFSDVDLIVGGISEKPANGSTVGPTFTCILAEQFSKIRQWHELLDIQAKLDLTDSPSYENWTGAELICANSQLKNVPKNIFKINSDLNPSIRCAALLRTKGPVRR